MRTRYTKLYTAWENENKKQELQNIPDSFLNEIQDYINQLNKTTASTGTISGNLTITERKYANQMFKELTEKRLNKIIMSELNGLPINAQALTPEEQRLHSNIRQLLIGYRQGPEFTTQIKSEPLKQQIPRTHEVSKQVKRVEDNDSELILVRFLQPLPAIMGIDMKAYGPFQPEELATIPRQNAENLLKRGIVKKVEINV